MAESSASDDSPQAAHWRIVSPDLLREFVSHDFQTRVVAPVESALTELRSFALNNVLMTNTPAVTVRVRTLHALFDAATQGADELERSRWLYSSGRNVGREFGYEFLDFLYKARLVPLSAAAALSAWATLDAGANWGIFTNRPDGDKTVVTLDNNFLDSLSPGTHRYCSFVAGYIHGTAWVLSRAWSRLKADAGGDSDPTENSVLVVPDAVTERDGTPCEFEIIWRTEQLPQATDHFFRLLATLRAGNREPLAYEMRLVGELALKEKLGAGIDEKLHIPSMVWAAKQKPVLAKAGLSFDELVRMAEICNKAVHGQPVRLEESEIAEFLTLLDDTLAMLEDLPPLGDGAKRETREKALERESRGSATFVIGDIDRGATVVVASTNVAAASSGGTANLSIAIEDVEAEVRRHLARLERALADSPPSAPVEDALALTRELRQAKRWEPQWLLDKVTDLRDLVVGIAAAEDLVEKIRGLLEALLHATH